MDNHYKWSNPQVGDIVYPSYTPSQAGKVIAVSPPQDGHHVTVRMANGKEYGSRATHLECFRSLVEGHQRKAKKQGDLLKELEG